MSLLALGELGAVLALAIVLAMAARAKLAGPAPAHRGRNRALAVIELAVAVIAVVAPIRVGAELESALFAGFSSQHIRQWRSHAPDCGCFGATPRGSGAWSAVLTAGSALGAAAIALAAPGSLFADAGHQPALVLASVVGAAAAALAWRRAFSASPLPLGIAAAGEQLVNQSAGFLERHLSRRTVLVRVAVAGSALCVAPLRYLLYPISAIAAIVPGDCGGGLCTDGFTVFCCEINHGLNTCPPGTFPGGWWMCTDYRGGGLCSGDGVRYYVDCNALPDTEYPGGCHCAHASCEYRRVACNIFRYGQCNPQIPGTTAVVCRMVVCENPSLIPQFGCSSSLAVDDSVCGQTVPCLAEPPAIELAGAGGV